MTWDKTFSFGTQVENLLKEYLEEVFGWTFVAGTDKGKAINSEYIESVFKCKVQCGRLGKGPRLIFDFGEVVMPDFLFRSKNNLLFWVESKAFNYSGHEYIDIENDKIIDYYRVKQSTDKPLWIVISIVYESTNCEIYAARIQDLIKNSTVSYNRFWEKDVRTYNLSDKIFKKLTNSPIKFS